jgi:hypothetical protein
VACVGEGEGGGGYVRVCARVCVRVSACMCEGRLVETVNDQTRSVE